MIDNRLKACCKECDKKDLYRREKVVDVFAETNTLFQDDAIIDCRYSNVCKKYIENQEVEG